MSRPRAIVVSGPGTNRERDAAFALDLAGASPEIVINHDLAADPARLRTAQILVVAGGFSYGDALGAGRMLALELGHGRTGDELRAFVAAGKPVLGICNGFQALVRAGLLPGALGHNSGGSFQCRWVRMQPVSQHCIWTRGLTGELHCPIAHGEGRYVPTDLDALVAADQVGLRYTGGTNPNGSTDDIAGVCNPSGTVLGLMPHPENAVLARQLPGRRIPDGHTRLTTLDLFGNGVTYAKES